MKPAGEFAGKRLDCAVKEIFFEEYFLIAGEELTRNVVQNALLGGKILVNGEIKKPSYKLRAQDVIDFRIEKKEIKIEAKKIPLDILYEDEFLIVLNKQKNLLSHPTSKNEDDTLVNALLYHTKGVLSNVEGVNRQGIVHRLDKNTAGIMLAAKTNEAHSFLKKDIQSKKTIRKYLAVCYGVIEADFGRIDKPLIHSMKNCVKMQVAQEGLSAVTKFKVLERFNQATFLELELETGRTHQIRCHLASIGHPIAGDELYGAKSFHNGVFRHFKTEGQVLNSYYIKFIHPVTNKEMEFRLPENKWHKDLRQALELLRKNS